MKSCDIRKSIWIGLLLCFVSNTNVFGDTPKSLLPGSSISTNGQFVTNKEVNDDKTDVKSEQKQSTKNGIEINKLEDLNADNIGVIDKSSGGFDKEMWGSTSSLLAKKLLLMAPTKLYSKSLRELYQRLLLTSATPPSKNDERNSSDLLFVRAHNLFALGYFGEFQRLINQIPIKYQHEKLAKLIVDAAFLDNDIMKACQTTIKWIEKSSAEYWQKALIFCDALNGNWDQVDFGIQLLAELKEKDRTFLALIRAMTNNIDEAILIESKAIRPLDVAMLRATRQALPEPGSNQPASWLLSSYILDPGIDQLTRLALAEEAVRLGIVGNTIISELYKTIPVAEKDIENAATIALKDNTTTARALLYRAALRQQSTFGKAQAIQQALLSAKKSGLFFQMANRYASILESIPLGSELGWFAAEAALLHTANLNFEQAKQWSELAVREAKIDTQAAQNWSRYRPLIRVLWGNDIFEWNTEEIMESWKADVKNTSEETRKVFALIFYLLEALDEPLPPEIWSSLIGKNFINEPKRSMFTNTRSIEMAVKNSNLAEAISLILFSLEDGDLNMISYRDLILIVEKIKQLGLKTEARHLAFEILIASYF